ncbi:MAG: methyltransferase domain-containing protein [bacterium]
MITKTVARGKPADYEQEIVKRRYRLTAELLSLENKIVLDFGCGNGAQTSEFLYSGCKIIAIDLSQVNLQIFADYLISHKIGTTIPVQFDGSHLPLASNSIDIVVSYEVLEHVQDETEALGEIHRVLKPGGEILFSVPNKGWVFETHGAYLPLLPWNRVPFFSWLPNAIHSKFAKARIYRKRDIVKLLRSHSFEVLSTQYITAPMDVVKNPWLKQLLRAALFGSDTTRFTFLSTAILIHGRKI